MFELLRPLLPRLHFAVVGAGKAGVGDGAAFSTTGVREGKTGEQVIGQAHGKYFEAASRGVLFCASGTTAAAIATILSTASPFVLYNPVGSGKYLSVKKVGFGQGTGTLGTGALHHTVFTIAGPVASQTGTIPSGTAIAPVPARVDQTSAAVGLVFGAATLAVAPQPVAPWLNLSEVASGTIGGNSTPSYEDVDGSITLAPGAGYAPQAQMAAGSSPTGYFGVVWEEIPIT